MTIWVAMACLAGTTACKFNPRAPIFDASTDAGNDSSDGGSPRDAGMTDAGLGGRDAAVLADGGLADVGLQDAGVDDAGVNDAGLNDAGLPPPDAGLPDAGPPDGGVPDVGIEVFPYIPSNFSQGVLPALVSDATLNCGQTTFDSTTNLFTGWCGPDAPPLPIVVPQANGIDAVLLPMNQLNIDAGSTLRLVGNRPVILVVYTQASINGVIDAGAMHEVPGAGGSLAGACANAEGSAGGAGSGTGGGGGGGGFGAGGANGGNGRQAGGTAGARGNSTGNANLVPMQGGCRGGQGGANGGLPGAGGGAVQISAAETLTVNGQLNAGGGGGRGGDGRNGGGGGGSGGAMLLEAVDVNFAGPTRLLANGGAGGEGGTNGNNNGQNGADANLAAGIDPAVGGSDSASAGDGGAGGARDEDAENGGNGATGQGGGGGGGGGVGRIHIHATSSCNRNGANWSPAPTFRNVSCN